MKDIDIEEVKWILKLFVSRFVSLFSVVMCINIFFLNFIPFTLNYIIVFGLKWISTIAVFETFTGIICTYKGGPTNFYEKKYYYRGFIPNIITAVCMNVLEINLW